MERARYPNKPIQTVASLARALGQTPGFLESIAQRAPDLYIGPKKKLKRDGVTYRDVFDTKAPLKELLRSINKILFAQVEFPRYLQGSIKGRDFVSNVEVHADAGVLISEDIRKFFDHITADHVHRIWHEFFCFGDAPSALLTKLTTNERRVFQGTPTSSYLANLALWDVEPQVVRKLAERGIKYSRYVDDVTLSRKDGLSSADKTWALAQIFAMFRSRGFTPAREKHSIQTARAPNAKPLSVMGLTVGRGRVSLPSSERASIRSMVHELEVLFDRSETGLEFRESLERASGKVGRLKRHHPDQAEGLRERLNAMRKAIVDAGSS